jgi:hypothetical protein
MDPGIEERISAVKKEIKAIAVEIARGSSRTNKRRRIDPNGVKARHEDQANVGPERPLDISSSRLAKGKQPEHGSSRGIRHGSHQTSANGSSDPSGIRDGLTVEHRSLAITNPHTIPGAISNSEICTVLSLL